jgi:5'-nucleotidase
MRNAIAAVVVWGSVSACAHQEVAGGVGGSQVLECGALKVLRGGDAKTLRTAGLRSETVARVRAAIAGEDGQPGTEDDVFVSRIEQLEDRGIRLDDDERRALARLGKDSACGEVPLQLLAFNDFHGALEPPSGKGGQIQTASGLVDAGGAEYVATWLSQLRAGHGNSVVVAAGDNIGATPLLSAAFHDEPTIEALNHFGLALTSVGNHEFDEGLVELLRMQRGGCHPTEGCFGGDGFEGAKFGYLAANVIVDATGATPFPAFAVRRFGGVPVAFIGMTLEKTPEVVTAKGVEGLSFRDEADTVNALVPLLRARGIEAIVVLLHEGGFATGSYDGCEGISGPVFDVAARFDSAVDIVVTGHTNAAHVCDLGGRLITSAAHNGRLVTDFDLTLSEMTGDFVKKAASNRIMTREVERDSAISGLISRYKGLVEGVSRRVVGSIADDLTRAMSPLGESALGSVIADAQLFAESDPSAGGAEVAFMNPGGIRADLLRTSQSGEALGEVTFGEIFSVQPFGNMLVTMTLSGAELEAVLEQQFDVDGAARERPKVLQVSHTLRYAIRADGGVPGDRIDSSKIEVSGKRLEAGRSYRVVVNEFLGQGGDGFDALKKGRDRKNGVVDVDALAYYLGKHPNLGAPKIGRIRK